MDCTNSLFDNQTSKLIVGEAVKYQMNGVIVKISKRTYIDVGHLRSLHAILVYITKESIVLSAMM